jgi:hypothetical protein
MVDDRLCIRIIIIFQYINVVPILFFTLRLSILIIHNLNNVSNIYMYWCTSILISNITVPIKSTYRNIFYVSHKCNIIYYYGTIWIR